MSWTNLIFERFHSNVLIYLYNSKRNKTRNILHTLKHHSEGFEWGYAGSGPSELSLNILYTLTDDVEFSYTFYIQFRNEFIIRLSRASKVYMDIHPIYEWLKLKYRLYSGKLKFKV